VTVMEYTKSLVPEFTETRLSEGGPKAWFATVRRKG
jgi:hypothetical protein